MRKKIACCFLFFACGFIGAQNFSDTREGKLQQLKTRKDITVTEVEPNILKLEYPNRKVLYKNIADYQHPTKWQAESNIQQQAYSPSYDSTIIDITTLDTTLYYKKFTYWQEVPLGNFRTLLVSDINNNKLPELYGQMKKYTTDYTDIVIFEMNQQGAFNSVYSYDTTVVAKSIYDIDKDGNQELSLMRNNPFTLPGKQYNFYKKESDSSLATNLFMVFAPFDSIFQQNDNYFGNWDGDPLTDQIFITLDQHINIFEYLSVQNNFTEIYRYNHSQLDVYYGGFSIGDFDQDNKTEILAGSVHGKVLSIENCGNNCYTPNWQGIVQTNNAYLCGGTNDLDGNGRKEIWIGGDALYGGVGKTRITIFEAAGNNSYQVVGKIDLVGIFSWDAGNIQVIDLDKDGKEEVLLGLDQTVLILKFNGGMNDQKYEVFYYRKNELALSGRNSIYYGAVLYDLNGDGKEDLIINMDEVIQNVGLRLFSYIYKANYTVDIKKDENQQTLVFTIYSSYPNPFNSQAKIKFTIGSHSFATIKVYNILGREIRTLLEKNLSTGEYTIEWDGKGSMGNTQTSGVYFIRMEANGLHKTIKIVLLK